MLSMVESVWFADFDFTYRFLKQFKFQLTILYKTILPNALKHIHFTLSF